jgi:hypothetical protein
MATSHMQHLTALRESFMHIHFFSRFDTLARWMLAALGALLALQLSACGGGGSGGDGSTATPGTATNVVTTDNGTVPTNTFTASLSGANAVPQNTSTAGGTGVVMVDPATLLLRATVTTAGIAASSVQIHAARPGNTGPLVIGLTQTATGSGIWAAEADITAEQLNALSAGDYYFNLASAAFPDGEIRGQILRQLPSSSEISITNTGTTSQTTDTGSGVSITGASGIDSTDTTVTSINDTPVSTTSINGNTSTSATLAASASVRRTMLTNVLSAAQVTGVVSTSDDAVAVSVVIIDHVAKTMSASITTMGIDGRSAHVHQAVAGKTGPIIFTLPEIASNGGIWALKTVLNDAQIKAIGEGGFYLDVHTATSPTGDVRGQVVKTSGSVTVIDNVNSTTTSSGTSGLTGGDASGSTVIINSGNRSSISM